MKPFCWLKTGALIGVGLGVLWLNQAPNESHATDNPILTGTAGREKTGASYWSSSNMREWLNSSADVVSYTNNPPTDSLTGGYGYDQEPGFLSAFTPEEIEQIAITEHRIFVSGKDSAAKEGGSGTTGHANVYGPVYLSNYSWFAFSYKNYSYKADNDKVFLINPTEAYWYLTRRGYAYNRTLTPEAAKKHNRSVSAVSWWLSSGTEHSDNDLVYYAQTNNLIQNGNVNNLLGVVPAFHLKPETVLSDGRIASDLSIGDALTFGRYLDQPIEWQVINITDSGYPLLLSTKVLDMKVFDAKGDGAKQFSETINWGAADVSILGDVQYKSTSGHEDVDVPSLKVVDNSPLLVRQNGSFNLDLIFFDEGGSGLDWVKLPNGQMASGESITYTFDANGSYVFKLMDNAGNYNEYLLAVSNINIDPSIMMGSTSSDWTNQDVTIDVKASTDVKREQAKLTLTNGQGTYAGGAFPNYISYAGSKFRISGKVKLVSYHEDARPYNLRIGIHYRFAGDSYYTQTLGGSWTAAKTIQFSDLIDQGETPFDFIYTIPANYYEYLNPWIESNMSGILGEKIRIEIVDLKYELLDGEGFAISSITLPDGTVSPSSSHTEVVSKEGTNHWSYMVTDSRGKITVRQITTKIDKTLPVLTLTENTSAWSTQKTIDVTASDAISGISKLTLPNNSTTTSTTAVYTITQNGTYAFKALDRAGNTKTVNLVVSTIDTTAPSASIKASSSAWTNQDVTLTLDAVDAQSGLHIMPYSFDGGMTWQSGHQRTFKANETVTAHVRDAVGNTTILTYNVTVIDKVAPIITGYDGVPEHWNDPSTLTLYAKDEGAGLHEQAYSFDGGVTWQSSASKSFISATTVTAIVRDKAGNLSQSVVITMGMIDKVPPVLDIEPIPDRLTATAIEVEFSLADYESGVASYTTPDGVTHYPEDKDAVLVVRYPIRQNGTYTFTVTDLAGHATTKTIEITQFSLEEAKTDSETHLEYKIESPEGALIQNWTPIADGEPLLLKGERHELLTARITDEVNKTSSEVSWIRIDQTAPIIHYAVSKEYGQTLRAVIDLEVIEAGGSMIASLAYSLNEGMSWIDISHHQFTLLGSLSQPDIEGLIKATDHAGNEATTRFKVSFDVTGPTVTLLGDGTTSWTNQPLLITAIASDESGIKSYSLPTGEVIQVTGAPKELTITYHATAIDTYTFTFEDAVGNQTTSSIFMDLIDMTNPNVAILNPSDGNWSSTAVTVEIVGSD